MKPWRVVRYGVGPDQVAVWLKAFVKAEEATAFIAERVQSGKGEPRDYGVYKIA